MAPDIAKVYSKRHLYLGLPAWNFSDEALRWLRRVWFAISETTSERNACVCSALSGRQVFSTMVPERHPPAPNPILVVRTLVPFG